MLKRLLLMTATFAVIVVLFLVYHLTTGGAVAPGSDSAEQLNTLIALKLPEDGPGGETPEAPRIENIPFGQASKTWVTWYDERTGKAKLQFRAAKWEPVGEREFHLVDLQVRMLTPSGQIAEVHADEGQVLMSSGELSEATFRRGWVRSNVRVLIDRSTPEWREQHPDQRDMASRPEHVVRIWTDELHFDLELSRIETESEFRLQSAEADLRGRGLVFRWNEEHGRIDYLEITRGKSLTLFGQSSRLDFSLFGAQTRIVRSESSDASDPEPPPTRAPEPTEEKELVRRTEDLDPELLILDAETQEVQRAPVTYQARFMENVLVEKNNGTETPGRMQADELALLFDMAQLKDASVVGADGQDASDEQTDASDAGADQDRITLTWTGPLIIEPETSKRSADTDRRRLHLEATGNPVRVSDRQGTATCAKLEYHEETGHLWLYGNDEIPVFLTVGADRSIRAAKLFYDHTGRVARLTGPGEMTVGSVPLGGDQTGIADWEQADDRDNRSIIRWSKSVELEFDQAEFEVSDPDSPEPAVARSPWIKRARLDGDVSMTQPGQFVRADKVEVDFMSPDEPGQTVTDVRRFEGTGGVRMKRGDDDIRCDRMVIHLATTPDGRNAPTSAMAYGNITAAQGHRVIRASESVNIRMRQVPNPQTDVTVEQARLIARKRGIDPDRVDWGAWAARQASRTETVIASLDCRGDVRIDDPGGELRVRAERVDCTFADEGRIDRVIVTSPPGIVSHVELEDFAISGRIIELDAAEPWALVPGPGRVEFYSDQGLDGSALSKPVPIQVAWQGRMELKGAVNQLQFEEQVRATSIDPGREQYTLDCRALSVNFIDLPIPREVSDTRDELRNYWIFDSLVRAVLGDGKSGRTSFSTMGSGLRFLKKPVYVLADGNAVAVATTFGPGGDAIESRMRIAGPRIAIDLRRQTSNVEGAGSLLIEDYRMPSPRDRRKSARPGRDRRNDPLLAEMSARGPSQSLFTWENSMSYLSKRNVAVFDRNVQMVHRAGGEMVLRSEVAAAHNLDVTQVQKLKGRRTQLSCGNLLVEFARDSGSRGQASGTRITQIAHIEATERVVLRDGTKTLVGDRLNYSRNTGLVTLRARRGREAHIYDEQSRSGSMRAHWRGAELRWYLNDNRVEATQASILLGGR